MGLNRVTLVIKANRIAEDKYEADFLVDTGATDSRAPALELKKDGSQLVAKTAYELADGTLRECEFGLCVIELMGDITAGRLIFGPDEVRTILGVTALEIAGI